MGHHLRAGRFVQGRIAALREDIYDTLNLTCRHELHWGAGEVLDADSRFEIRNAVTEVFEFAGRKWHYNREVLQELDSVAERIKDALEIALDVPHPTIHRVVENIIDMFDRRWSWRLEYTMFEYAVAAMKIQDGWRKCYYEPDHLACRRRLMRQFNACASDLEALRV